MTNRRQFLRQLSAAGFGVGVGQTIVVAHDQMRPVTISPAEVPGLIDELPAIAALAAHGGEVTVSGAAELRVKESDRITALVDGMRALGLTADERPDGFSIAAPRRPTGGVAHARSDHRMARKSACSEDHRYLLRRRDRH